MKLLLASLPLLTAHVAAGGIDHGSQEDDIPQLNHQELGIDQAYAVLAQRQVTIRPVISTSVGLTTISSNGLTAVVPTNIIITLTSGTTILPSLSSSFTSPQSQIDGSAISSTKVVVTTSVLVSTSIKESILTLTSFAPPSSSTAFSAISSPKTTSLSSPTELSISFVPSVTGTSNAVPISSSSLAPTPTTKPRIVPAAGGYTYLGCYTEGSGVRALNGTFWPDDTNTIEKCVAACFPFKYAGNEYGRECWCGEELNTGSVLAPDSQCVMPCPGNSLEYCGGSIRISVYVRDGTGSGSQVSVPQIASSTIVKSAASSSSTSFISSVSLITLSLLTTSLASSTSFSLQTAASSPSNGLTSSSLFVSSTSSNSASSSFTLPSPSSSIPLSSSSSTLSKPPTVKSSSQVSTSVPVPDHSSLSKSLSVNSSQISTPSPTFSSAPFVTSGTKDSSTASSAALTSDSPTPSPSSPASIIVDNGLTTTLSYTFTTTTDMPLYTVTVTITSALSLVYSSKSASVTPDPEVPVTYNSSPINALPSTTSIQASNPSETNLSVSVKITADFQSNVVTYSFTRPALAETSTVSLASFTSIHGPSTARSVYVYSPPTLNCPNLTPDTVTVTQILTVAPSSVIYSAGISSEQSQSQSSNSIATTAIPDSAPPNSGSSITSKLPIMPWMTHSDSPSVSHTHTISRSILSTAPANGTAPITTLTSGRFEPSATGVIFSTTTTAGAPLSKTVSRKRSLFLAGVLALRILV